MTQNSGTVSDSFYLAALIESYSYSSSLVWEQYELRARANRAQECMLQQTGGKIDFFYFSIHVHPSVGIGQLVDIFGAYHIDIIT